MPDTYNKDEIWYEIFSKNASKASALLQVMELTHADRSFVSATIITTSQ